MGVALPAAYRDYMVAIGGFDLVLIEAEDDDGAELSEIYDASTLGSEDHRWPDLAATIDTPREVEPSFEALLRSHLERFPPPVEETIGDEASAAPPDPYGVFLVDPGRHAGTIALMVKEDRRCPLDDASRAVEDRSRPLFVGDRAVADAWATELRKLRATVDVRALDR